MTQTLAFWSKGQCADRAADQRVAASITSSDSYGKHQVTLLQTTWAPYVPFPNPNRRNIAGSHGLYQCYVVLSNPFEQKWSFFFSNLNRWYLELNDLLPGTVDLLFILFHSVSFRLYLRWSSTTLLSLSTNLHQVRIEFISMEDLWACFDLDLEFYGTCLKIIGFFCIWDEISLVRTWY